MTKFRTGTYRQVRGYLGLRPTKHNTQQLSTSGAVDDELWTLLEYYSEVEEVGLKFLETRGITNLATRKKIYKYFQAHVRQAKNYYYSAKILAPRSSGLLYYYCFHNLAKAALVIKDPSIAGKPGYHGLKYEIDGPSNFSRQTVQFKPKGVFPELYEWYFGKKLKPTSLSIITLLNYCSDISYQRLMAGIDSPRILRCLYMSCSDSQRGTGWSLIAIPRSELLLKYGKSFSVFLKNFEKVTVPQLECREIFHIDALEQSSLVFFQSSTEKNWPSSNVPPSFEVRDELLASLSTSYQEQYFTNREEGNFVIALPYSPQNQIQMDETMAIYLIMFYLSNLVRYKPHYLESLLNKKEAWLIDSFTRSCAVTFLRAMISRITGTDYLLCAR